MECESNKTNLSSETVESPGSSLLERLKNLRKWQDDQCRELRARQFLSSDQTSQFVENSTKETTGSEHVVRYEMNLSPKVSTSMSKALVCEDVNKAINDRNPGSFQPYALEDIVTKEKVSVKGNRYLLEDSQVVCGTSVFDGETHAENATLSQQSYEISSENLTITPSTDEEESNINHEQVLKESNDWRESRACNVKPKFDSPKYENDDVRKFHGLSSFIKNHAGISDAAYSHDPDAANGLEAVPKPKFRFLKKGEGTARFGMKTVKIKPKVCKDKLKSDSSVQKLDEGKQSKADVKVSTEASCDRNGIEKYPKPKYILKIDNRPLKTLQLESVRNMVSNRSIVENYSVKKNLDPNEISLQRPDGGSNIQQVFGSDMIDYDKQGCKEQEELSAFEKLEELAEDSSFSSNCSAVVHLLRRGQHSASSTPVRSRPSTPQLNQILDPTAHRNIGDQNPSYVVSNELCQNQFPLVNVSQILEQLRGIVRLKHADESSLSQDEIMTLVESYMDSDTSIPSEFASYLATNMMYLSSNPTSTPAVIHHTLPSRPRVHFRPEGVEVLEYECSDSGEENTLTDTPSIVDDTDLVTTSDLEILAHFDEKHNVPAASMEQMASLDKMQVLPNDLASSDMQSTPKLSQGMLKSANRECLQPLKLQFSPPQRPQNSASHYIWSIFGKNKVKQNGLPSRKRGDESSESGDKTSQSRINAVEKETEKVSSQTVFQDKNQQEVETCKTLLMAKVCELEKETDFFKRENHKLTTLQKSLQNEKSQLDIERKNFQLEMEREKNKFREYIDSERNKLWKEKQAPRVQPPSVSEVREQSLEIVYLKEQLHDAKEEIGKKASLHQFTVKKLNEKIKILEEEIKLLKEKNSNLQKLEKENLHLKHEVDRTKVMGKTLLKNKPKANASRHANFKVKRATISNINKSLDKVTIAEDFTTTKPVSRLPPAVQITESSNKFSIRNSQEHPKRVIDSDSGSSSDLANEVCGNIHVDKIKGSNVIDLQPTLAIKDQESSGRTEISEVKDSPRPFGNIGIDYTELCRDDGTKEIIYANGNKKEILSDGSVFISYYNGDRKEVFEDKTVYIYGTDSTRHTTYSDGREILEFPNGQKETRFPDGSSEIIFTDNTRKTLMPDGTEICVIKDGTVVRTNLDGIKVFEFVSGQKEIHTPEEKRREYPDGTVKILHRDGRTETRYKKGRVRVKDKEGNVITDTHQSVQ